VNTGFDIPSAESRRFAGHVSALRMRLVEVYGDEVASDLVRTILQTVAECRDPARRVPARSGPGPRRWSERDAVLITYASSLRAEGEAPLRTLHGFLRDHLRDVFSTIHVLPFCPWSSDDGFAVIDYYGVDPRYGSWEDLHALAGDFALMADLVLNHVSRESLWFIDFINDRAPGRDFFLAVDPAVDLSRVVRPRVSPLLVPIHTYRGLRHVWATFSEDQIDLDFSEPRVLAEMVRIFCFYLSQGVRVVRLDAIAYLWKEIGTACIHHPHTHRIVQVLRLVAELACDPEVDPAVLITETNVPHSENVSYFGRGDEAHLVYQFALAPLTLHALTLGTSRYVMQWAQALGPPPKDCTFLNFTASHDGVGLRPAEGLLPEQDIEQLVGLMHRFGGFVSMRTAADGSERPYEINISLFDALKGTVSGEDGWQVPRFLASQVLMLSLQGIPAMYIHSLLATPNDLDGVERTGRTRSINRREWSLAELQARLADPASPQAQVKAALEHILRVRATAPAFSPDAPQRFQPVSDALVTFRRGADAQAVTVVVNVTDVVRRLDAQTLVDLGLAAAGGTRATVRDLLTGDRFSTADGIALTPYRCLWLVA
jgi:sucrose phosphorylase